MNTSFDLSFQNDIKQLLAGVPPQVRDALTSGKVETITKSLMEKNRLHLDQGTVLEREVIMLLLGIKNPEEFSQALIDDAQLSQQTITGIMQDINNEIFIPIRDQMKNSKITVTERPENSTKHVVPAPVVPTPHYAPPPAPAPSLHTAPLPPKLIPQARRAIWNSLPPHPTSTQKLLEDHEEPHIEFKKSAPPPPNLPGAFMPKDTHEEVSLPIVQSSTHTLTTSPEIKTQIRPAPVPTAPPVAPYTSDPYREPID